MRDGRGFWTQGSLAARPVRSLWETNSYVPRSARDWHPWRLITNAICCRWPSRCSELPPGRRGKVAASTDGHDERYGKAIAEVRARQATCLHVFFNFPTRSAAWRSSCTARRTGLLRALDRRDLDESELDALVSFSAAIGRGYWSKMPTIEADMRLAMVPAIMARKPSLASSPRLFGASALMPPI